MTAPRHRPRTRLRRLWLLTLLATVLGAGPAAGLTVPRAVPAASYVRISGEGSTWAAPAVHKWSADLDAQGQTVDYSPDGSSVGRRDFATGQADFAVSQIPYRGVTADPQDSLLPSFDYGLLPVVAGGTSFMYNLVVDGTRFGGLQLSQAALAGIFSGQITRWDDPAIAATNPGVDLPPQAITVVVRSDGAGSTALLTQWLLRQFPQQYQALCARAGCDPTRATSYFPSHGLANFTAQSGSNGVTTYTASTPFTIDYDAYSYAQGVGFPVARIQNAAGFFTTPTAGADAVALTQARFDGDRSSDAYLSQDLSHVYGYGDPRTYPFAAYADMIVPQQTHDGFDLSHGAALGSFAAYAVCQGQQTMGALGYSPLPMNLVLASMDQVLRIPGVDAATRGLIADTEDAVASGDGDPCGNPAYTPGADPAHNALVDTAPFPDGCDAACQAPWLGDQPVTVTPQAETPAALDDAAGGDADADDPAIWVDRAHPSGARVIGTLGGAGLAVYDLRGRSVQAIAAPAAPAPGDEAGRFDDVDVVRNVDLDGRRTAVVVVSDRGRDQIRTYAIDRATGRLSDVTSPRAPFAFSADQAGVDEQATIDGLDAFEGADGQVYVIGTRRHTSQVAMFRLVPTPRGVTYRRVDTLTFPDTFTLPDRSTWSPCEPPGEGPQLGCVVVDQASHRLYAAQEDVGLWRVDLGPHGFAGAPVNVERVSDFGVPATYDADADQCVRTGADPGLGGRIAADIEGVAIYATGRRDGTLVVSSQGDSTFYTYDRRTLAPLMHVAVGASPTIDAVQDSAGVDTVATALPGFPHGLLVVQDGENTPDVTDGAGDPRPNTDFKYVDAAILQQH